MIGKILDSNWVKKLSGQFDFISFLYKARILKWNLSNGLYPIYLDYPVASGPRYGYGKPPHYKLYEIIDRGRTVYEEILKDFFKLKDCFQSISVNKATNPQKPYWKNGVFTGLDPLALYFFFYKSRPVRYIEIGSGNSTKFARQAIEDHQLNTEIISIDPHPRSEIDSVCDICFRQTLGSMELELFDTLQDGDILFIDGSHRCFTNSDVTVFFLDILPRLNPGVLIGFDDVYLPFDYPPDWNDRYYSEQYLLSLLLLFQNNQYEIMLPCAFVANDEGLKRNVDSIWYDLSLDGVKGYGNSFWMRVQRCPNDINFKNQHDLRA